MSTALASASSALAGSVSTESSRAVAAEGALSTALASASSSLASGLAAVNTRVDNVLSNVDAVALNSLAEIVSAFQSADSDINGAISTLAGNASTNLQSVSTALAGSISGEVSRATAAEQAIAGDLSDEVTRATAAEQAIAGDLSDEVTRATAAEQAISSDLSDEVTRATAAEQAIAGDLSDAIDTLNGSISSVESNLQDQIDSLNTGSSQALSQAVSGVNSSIASLSSDMISRDAAVLSAANAYADNKIDELVGSAPGLLNTLNELASAIGNDENFVTTMANSLNALSGAATSASGRLDVIESNFIDKSIGGTVNADLTVTGNFEVGSGISTLFVGSGVVGINTETPSEALDIVGNGKFSGTVQVATPTLSGHAATKSYVDNAIAILNGGQF